MDDATYSDDEVFLFALVEQIHAVVDGKPTEEAAIALLYTVGDIFLDENRSLAEVRAILDDFMAAHEEFMEEELADKVIN